MSNTSKAKIETLKRKASEYEFDEEFEKAFKCYMEMADSGSAYGQLNVARCYRDGKGTNQNNYTAIDWFKKAAENKDANACNELAILLSKDSHPNYSEVLKYADMAIKINPSNATFRKNKDIYLQNQDLHAADKKAGNSYVFGGLFIALAFFLPLILVLSGVDELTSLYMIFPCIIIAVIFFARADSAYKNHSNKVAEKNAQIKAGNHETVQSYIERYREKGGTVSQRVNIDIGIEIVLALDDVNRKIIYANNGKVSVYDYKNLLSHHLSIKEYYATVRSKKTKAIVGGVIAGSVGAIAGAAAGDTTEKYTSSIVEEFRFSSSGAITISFIKEEMKSSSQKLRAIQEKAQTFDNMLEHAKTLAKQPVANSKKLNSHSTVVEPRNVTESKPVNYDDDDWEDYELDKYWEN